MHVIYKYYICNYNIYIYIAHMYSKGCMYVYIYIMQLGILSFASLGI